MWILCRIYMYMCYLKLEIMPLISILICVCYCILFTDKPKMSLTDDLVEWLVADKKVIQVNLLSLLKKILNKVCSKWMSIASRLGVSHLIPTIASSNSRRQYQDERSKLKMVIQLWRNKRPESYNLKELKAVLAQEVRWGEMKKHVS